MNTNHTSQQPTNVRWTICAMLFVATVVNYMDRQALSLRWKDFIAPEFHWTDEHYGNITALFAIVYAVGNMFSGRLVDRLGTKNGYLLAIGVWSVGACIHAFCGWATAKWIGVSSITHLIGNVGEMAAMVASVSVYFFMTARVVLAVGEMGNFPAAIKATAEYFPKEDRAFATAIFNFGATMDALVAPPSIPILTRAFQQLGFGNGWECGCWCTKT